jgi:hypothetical protein
VWNRADITETRMKVYRALILPKFLYVKRWQFTNAMQDSWTTWTRQALWKSLAEDGKTRSLTKGCWVKLDLSSIHLCTDAVIALLGRSRGSHARTSVGWGTTIWGTAAWKTLPKKHLRGTLKTFKRIVSKLTVPKMWQNERLPKNNNYYECCRMITNTLDMIIITR